MDPTLEFCGCLVSIDCGKIGYFQGKVLNVNKDEKTITIERPLKNGIPMVEKTLILASPDIHDIKVIKMPLSSASTCLKPTVAHDNLPKVSNNRDIIDKKLKADPVTPVKNNDNITEIKTSKVLVKLQQQPSVSNPAAPSASFGIQNVPVSVLSGKNSKAIVSKLSEKCNKSNNNSSVEGLRISVSDLLLNKDLRNVQSLASLSASKAAAVATTGQNAIEKKKVLPLRASVGGKPLNSKEVSETKHEVSAPRNINISKRNDTQVFEIPMDPTLEFCGCLVSIDCGRIGYFQGKVLNVNKDEKTITIERPLKNGIPMVEKTLILASPDIHDIKVIKMPLSSASTCLKPTVAHDNLPKVSNNRDIIDKKLKADPVTLVKNNDSITEIKTSKVLVKLHQQQPSISNLVASSASFNIQNVPVSVLSGKNSKAIVSKLSEKSDKVKNNSSVEGLRISVSDLLLNKDVRNVQSLASISASKAAALSISDENAKEKALSLGPAVGGKPLKYKEFGEFRHFEEQEVPAPRNINVSKRNNSQGPCGIPLVDFSNGYTGFSSKCAELDDPIDFNLLQTDFDFDGNLALFNKHKLSESDDLVSANDTGPPPIVTKNFRNDENVLADPSRTISWTQKCNASSSLNVSKPIGVKGLRISVNELLNNDVGQQPECFLTVTE